MGDSDELKQIIGIHWIPVHSRGVDLKFASDIKGSINKVVGGPLDVQQVSDLYNASPGSMIILRDHPLSEQKEDMANDPAGTGTRHAEEMIAHYHRMKKQAEERGLPYPEKNRVILIGINEPNLDAGPRNKKNYKSWLKETERLARVVDEYNAAFLRRCAKDDFHGGAMNISVGWPANLEDDAKPYWGFFEKTEKAIKEFEHFLIVHEYWSNQGPLHMWGWWAGRFIHCPWDVPIIIGECGLDQYVADGGVSMEQRGWLNYLSKEEYSAQIIHYCNLIWPDRRIVGMTPFTSDCNHKDWRTFDLEPTYPYLTQVILNNKLPKRSTVNLPSIRPINGGFVIALDGLNVRSGPGIDYHKVSAIPYGTRVDIYQSANGWHDIGDGWVFAAYIGKTMPETPDKDYDEKPEISLLIENFSRIFNVDKNVVRAIFKVESGGRAFDDNGRMIIRFENHLFNQFFANQDTYDKHFRHGEPRHENHFWRGNTNGEWIAFHGNQDREWEVFEFAYKLNSEAAIKSISMGMGQIMGFNAGTLGYGSPQEMFDNFKKNEVSQVLGFFGYLYNKEGMLEAIKNKDWNRIGALYNGAEAAGIKYKNVYDQIK